MTSCHVKIEYEEKALLENLYRLLSHLVANAANHRMPLERGGKGSLSEFVLLGFMLC